MSPTFSLYMLFKARFHKWMGIHLPQGSIRHSIVLGGGWLTIGATLSRAFALLGSILLARLLGKDLYGKWGIILVVLGMFSQYAGLGFATIVTRYLSLLKEVDSLRAGRVLSFCMFFGMSSAIVMSTVCLAAAKWIAIQIYSSPDLFVPLLFASTLLFFTVTTNILQGVLAGFEDFYNLTVSNVVQGLMILIAAVPLTWMFGLSGLVAGMSISWFLASMIALVSIFKDCNKYGICITTREIWKERHILWEYALPNLLTGGVVGPATALSQTIVATMPGGFSQLGGYSAAARWRQLVLFIPQNLRKVTLPMLSRARGHGDRRRFTKALWVNISGIGGIALLTAIPIMVLSPWVLGLYGPDFRQDWDIMVVLLMSGIFQAVNDVVTQVTATLKKMWWNFLIHVIWAGVLLGGTVSLVGQYGVRGYVWAFTLATFLHMCINIAAAVVWIKHDPFTKAC